VRLWGGVYHKAFFYLVFDVGWVQSVVDMPLSELYGIYLEYQQPDTLRNTNLRWSSLVVVWHARSHEFLPDRSTLPMHPHPPPTAVRKPQSPNRRGLRIGEPGHKNDLDHFPSRPSTRAFVARVHRIYGVFTAGGGRGSHVSRTGSSSRIPWAKIVEQVMVILIYIVPGPRSPSSHS
jgi:hypothetical protein